MIKRIFKIAFQFINPKSEVRNSKQIQNPKFKCPKLLNFCHLIFGFVSDLEIRISKFISRQEKISM